MVEKDYAAVMEDVRRAWRIVAAYQQRIMFLLREFEAGLAPLRQCFWEPIFYSRPGSGAKAVSEKWSWDYLPFYQVQFSFSRDRTPMTQAISAGDRFMVVAVSSDDSFSLDLPVTSGFYGPDPAAMLPVEEAESWLSLWFYEVTGTPGKSVTRSEVLDLDSSGDETEGAWIPLDGVPVRRLYLSAPIRTLLPEGGTAPLIAALRSEMDLAAQDPV